MNALEAATTILTTLISTYPELKDAIQSIINALQNNTNVSQADLDAVLEKINLNRQKAIDSETVLLGDK